MTEQHPSPADIVGTHTYENVLYSNDTETPVNVLTGQTPSYAQAALEEAKAFAARLSHDHDKPYVAKSTSIESQIETQSKPYSGVVFYHFSLVGGMDMHKAFAAAWDSPEYTVEHTADYETGTLTITVEKISA